MTFPELAWYLMPRFPIPPKSAANARRLREHSGEAIKRHQRLADSSTEDQVRSTLFSKLYKAKNEDSLSFTNMRDSAQVYLTAGTGTTATSLTFLVWSVCKDQIIKEKLLAELQGHLKAKGLGDDFGYADIKDLPYLNCVIKETLRLYSAIPTGMPRVAPKGGSTLAGHFVPGGTIVAAQAYSMHRIEEVFPDAESFIPERWENPTKAMKDSFMAFGGGSRGKSIDSRHANILNVLWSSVRWEDITSNMRCCWIVCIGYHLAEMQMRLATARFFHAFPNARASQKDGMSDEDMIPTMFVLMSTKGQRCLIEGL